MKVATKQPCSKRRDVCHGAQVLDGVLVVYVPSVVVQRININLLLNEFARWRSQATPFRWQLSTTSREVTVSIERRVDGFGRNAPTKTPVGRNALQSTKTPVGRKALPNHFPRLGNLIPPRPLSPTRGGIRNLTLPVHFPRLEGGILSGNLEQVAIWAYLTLTLTLTLTRHEVG